ncbi:MAG TPA: ATP synthase subunit I [Gallionellaceae bacterium]|nr:ATP synthase subunit I [Gallionellaceae bacterium]
MRSDQVRLAGIQGAITLISAAVTYLFATPLAAGSVAYGGFAAAAGTLYLAWRLVSGRRREHLGAEWILRHAYRTAVERFVLVACLLAVGFELLRLAPLWLLAGFIWGQLAWLAAPLWSGSTQAKG